MHPIEEHTTNLSTGTIFSLQSGPVSGQPILLLHGMKFNAETWKELGTLDILADAGFRTIALDMPGFGKSPESALAASVVLTEFLQAEDIKQPILIGPSMGGKICLEFCIAHPESVKALVLIGPVGVQENAAKLKEIEVPSLIVWGSEDSISPIENGQLLDQELKKSTFVIIDGAPHPCYLQETAQWHKELLNFLNQENV